MHYLNIQVICGDVHTNHKHVFTTHSMWPVSCKAVEMIFYLGRHNQVIEIVDLFSCTLDKKDLSSPHYG